MSNISINSKVLIVAGMTASAMVGGTVGWIVSSKIKEKEFEERLGDEIQKAKELYQNLYSTPAVVERDSSEIVDPIDAAIFKKLRSAAVELDGHPEDLVGQALDAVNKYQGAPDEEEDRNRVPETNNLFNTYTPPGDEVLAALMVDRDPEKPYIITKSEYFENEPDHEQLAMTYWSGDDVLVDDREDFTPLLDIERIAGEENLMHFGYGSGDENIVYIRNESVSPPFDLVVTRSTGKYGMEVQGEMDGDHLEHSQPIRKMRPPRDE